MSRNSLKVLHVLHRFPPRSLGGTEINVYLLARAQGVSEDVKVAYPFGSHPAGSSSFPFDTFKAVGFPLPSGFIFQKLWESLPENGVGRREAAALLDRVRPDVIHVHHLQGCPPSLVDLAQDRGILVFFRQRETLAKPEGRPWKARCSPSTARSSEGLFEGRRTMPRQPAPRPPSDRYTSNPAA